MDRARLPPDLAGSVGSWLWGSVCLQRRLLGHFPCCLMVSLCQMHSFFFLGLDSQPNISDPWSRVTASSPVSRWWLCCVLLGSEMIPAGLYFCTKPCKGSLEGSFQGPWPILLLGSEGGVSSGCSWANSHQQETWTWLCLVSLWTEWRGDVPPCR